MNRVRKFLARPVVSGVLLAALLYSLWRVPSADTTTCSFRGWTLPGLLVGTSERIIPTSIFLIRSENGFRVEDIDRSSTQGLIDAVGRNPDDVVRALLTYERHARGLYDATSFRDQFDIELRPITLRTLTEDETAQAKAAFAGWLASKNGGGMPAIADALLTNAPPRAIVNWPGVFNTAIAVVGWPLFVLSLAWVPPAVRAHVHARNQRALSEGRCPRCGYETAGLNSGTCPECGRALHA